MVDAGILFRQLRSLRRNAQAVRYGRRISARAASRVSSRSPDCRRRSCSSAPAVSTASATSCSGISPTRSCISARGCGLISRWRIWRRRSRSSPAASGASASAARPPAVRTRAHRDRRDAQTSPDRRGAGRGTACHRAMAACGSDRGRDDTAGAGRGVGVVRVPAAGGSGAARRVRAAGGGAAARRGAHLRHARGVRSAAQRGGNVVADGAAVDRLRAAARFALVGRGRRRAGAGARLGRDGASATLRAAGRRMGAVRVRARMGRGHRRVLFRAPLRAGAPRARGVAGQDLGGSLGRDCTERTGRDRGQPVVPRAARGVPAAVSQRGGLLDYRRPDRESAEALRRREGQRQRVSGTRRGHGPHRQSDRSGSGAAARAHAARSGAVIGVAVLGSTGSVGESTLDVLARHPDRYRLVAIAANSSAAKLAQQVLTWHPAYAALADEHAAGELRELLGRAAPQTRVLAGGAALEEIAQAAEVQCVMAAIVGAAGLRSTLAAARAGKRLLLANKEALVMAGPLLIAEVKRSGATLLPIDSEHNAIFQCLPPGVTPGAAPPGLRRVLLTASGGPFRDLSGEALAFVTPEAALAHPNWVMGRKISVDSATLMNKGLEFIEACLLFGLTPAQVQVVVHPQSSVHSLVEYLDGSVLAQLSAPDMRTPIAHALAWPDRISSGVEFLDLLKVGRLDFRAPDSDKFPCLALAQAAARAGGLHPVVLNAANEVAVEAFLERRLNFPGIATVIEAVVQRGTGGTIGGLEDVLAADAEGRVRAREQIVGITRTAAVGDAHA